MNRKQRREYVKKMKRIGLTKAEALSNIALRDSFHSGDRVKINYEKIMKRSDKLSEQYIQFIEENKNRTFTISEAEGHKGFYILDQDPTEAKWLWTIYDFIKVS